MSLEIQQWPLTHRNHQRLVIPISYESSRGKLLSSCSISHRLRFLAFALWNMKIMKIETWRCSSTVNRSKIQQLKHFNLILYRKKYFMFCFPLFVLLLAGFLLFTLTTSFVFHCKNTNSPLLDSTTVLYSTTKSYKQNSCGFQNWHISFLPQHKSLKMVRKLKFHEQKLLKKVDFLNWKVDNNLHEVKVMRKYNIHKREDYTT